MDLEATQIGISNEAVAVTVETEAPSVNSRKHITVAVPPEGNPHKSNDIAHWVDLPEPVSLSGVVEEYYEGDKDASDRSSR